MLCVFSIAFRSTGYKPPLQPNSESCIQPVLKEWMIWYETENLDSVILKKINHGSILSYFVHCCDHQCNTIHA